MLDLHARKYVVLKRPAGSKVGWKFHRSFVHRRDAWNVAKAMKDEGRYETKTVTRDVVNSMVGT